MKKLNIIIIALAALSLTGCKSLYGNYERPDVKTNGIVRDPVDDKAALEGANDLVICHGAVSLLTHICRLLLRKRLIIIQTCSMLH